MNALILLMLAADPMVAETAPPPPAVEVPEWDLGAQVSLSALQSLNGIYLGIAACGATSCYSDSTMPMIFGVLGAGSGFALSLLDQESARGWGRALFVDSAIVGAGLVSALVATQPTFSLGPQLGYSVIFLVDAALTATAMVIARHITPRPETVLLADSLGLWGVVLGGTAASLAARNISNPFGFNPGNYMLAGALAGLAAGGMLGFSAQQMSLWRVLIANATALLGALLVGGGLAILESSRATPSRPYEPAVPAAGLAAGIAGGFLVGFVFSEGL